MENRAFPIIASFIKALTPEQLAGYLADVSKQMAHKNKRPIFIDEQGQPLAWRVPEEENDE